MANIKSAKKRVLVAERNHEKNVKVKSEIKTALKKALALAKEGSSELDSAVSKAYKLCDPAPTTYGTRSWRMITTMLSNPLVSK